jgi:hypothetical protein
MDTSIFEQIASSLRVRSLCDPLSPDVHASSTIAEVMEQLDPDSHPHDLDFDPINNPSRVIDSDGAFIGMLWCDDYSMIGYGSAITVKEVMRAVAPDEFLSSGTAIMDAVSLFATKPNGLFYVIDGNQVTGVLHYNTLFKPLGRLAFLALALEIEDQAVRLCQSALLREGCWSVLSEGRKADAIEVFKQRYKREIVQGQESDIFRLISCTHLEDKANMIWKQKLIAGARRSDVLSVFHRLKEVRNRCAHPGDYGPLLPRDDLADFVKSARSLRRSLQETLLKHGVRSRVEEPGTPI